MIKTYLNLPGTIHILCLGTLINRAGSFLVPFMTIYLRESLGLDVQFATLAMGVFGIGSMVASFTGGSLADRIGRRRVMLISLTGSAGMLLIFGFLRTPGIILAGVLVFSLLAEMYRPASSAMVADLVDPEQKNHAFGLMFLFINLGFCIAATVGGMLARHSFQWLFWGDALTSGVFALIILRTVPETLPSRHSAISEDGKAEQETTHVHIPDRDALLHIAKNFVFVLFCLGCFSASMVYMQGVSTFPLYLSELGIGADTYGRIIALNGLLIVCFQIPVTTIVSRYSRGLMMALSAVVMGVGFGAIGLAETVWQFAGTVVIWTLGEMMQAALVFAIATDLAPQEMRGRYLGVFSVAFAGAHIFGAPLGGYVLKHAGGQILWTASFALLLITALLFLSIARLLQVHEGKPLET